MSGSHGQPVPFSPPHVLQKEEAHVWHVDLGFASRYLARWKSPLSTDEQQRAARFKFDVDRSRFSCARGVLRHLLAAYAGRAPQEIQFTYSENGKPELRDCAGIRFNVSHSDNVAVFAVAANRRIGIDIEKLRDDVDFDAIPRRFFSEVEQREIAALSGEEKIAGFFNCWTRKEAYVKAVGTGLSLPLRDFDVTLRPGEPARLIATRPNPELAKLFILASLDIRPEFASALAIEGPLSHLEVRAFNPGNVPDSL